MSAPRNRLATRPKEERLLRRRLLGVLTAAAALAAGAPGGAAATAPVVAHVDASTGWATTGIELEAGRTYTLAAVGHAFTTMPNGIFPPERGSGRAGGSGPEGQRFVCANIPGGTCALAGAPFGQLVGRVGTMTFAIGAGGSFTAPAGGALELAVNDYLEFVSDNSGGYTLFVR